MTVKELIDILNTCEDKNAKVLDRDGDEIEEDKIVIDNHEVIIYYWDF